jgi:hypothetical protein
MPRGYRPRKTHERYVHKPGAKLYHAVHDGPFGWFTIAGTPCPSCNSVCPTPFIVTDTPPDGLRPCKQCLSHVDRERQLEMLGVTESKDGDQ